MFFFSSSCQFEKKLQILSLIFFPKTISIGRWLVLGETDVFKTNAT